MEAMIDFYEYADDIVLHSRRILPEEPGDSIQGD